MMGINAALRKVKHYAPGKLTSSTLTLKNGKYASVPK